MSPRRHSVRPSLERLEGRDTPSNFTVSFSSLTRTLTVTGDSLNNNLTVQAVAGDATKFTLSSTSDTFNNVAGPLTTPSGVQNLTLVLRDGDDSVTFGNTPVPIDLRGNLSVMGGNGANSVTATDMTVRKNLTVVNGLNASGTDVTSLYNPNIGGRLTINNGNGNTLTDVYRTSAGRSTIGQHVSITNGAGSDYNRFYDINFGGNVTMSNGRADAMGAAGRSWLFNSNNTGYRSVVKGNVSVSYLDGTITSFGTSPGYDGIWDMNIFGNVTFNHGAASAVTNFDGFRTDLPVIIRGNLTLTGSGANTVTVGTQYKRTGLILGKNLTVTTGGAADTLTFNKLEVGGKTSLALGHGANAVTIDDSVFAGLFSLTTGTGTDTVSLETAAASGGPTTFERPVLMTLGAGDDQLTRSGATDANQLLIVLDRFIVHHGAEPGDVTFIAGPELFPFGTSIQWIV